MTETSLSGPWQQLRGLLRVQAVAALAAALLMSLVSGPELMLVALAGGAVSFAGYAWAGYRLWLRPARRPGQEATRAISAELGRAVITLCLFWLAFSEWPLARNREGAATLLAAFFCAQVAGWIWLARASGHQASR